MRTGVESFRANELGASEVIAAMARAAPGGFLWLDPAGFVRAANEAAWTTLGLADVGQLIGRAWGSLLRPGAVDPVTLALARGTDVPTHAPTDVIEDEVDLIVAGGGVVRQSLRVSTCGPAGGTAGAVVLFVGAADPRGADARRARLDERRRWLERAIEELPTAVYMVDLDDGRLIYENDFMRALIGRPLPIGSTVEARACEVPIRDPATGRALEHREYPSMRAARGEVVRDCPLTWITSHGPRDVLVNAHAIPAGAGSGGVVVVSVVDLTPLGRVQRHLEQSEARLRQALRGGDVGTWYVDLASGQFAGSARARELFDHDDAPAAVDELVHARVHPADQARVSARWAEALRSDEPYADEYRVRRRDGSVRWVLSRGRPEFGPDHRLSAFAGVLTDVTERVRGRRRLERAKRAAEAANEAKTDFLANVSHELRTPLGVILGFAELAREADTAPGERLDALEIIARNGRALTRLIDDLLDLAKVEAGQMNVEAIPVAIRDLVRETVESFRERARAANISLDAHFGDGVPPWIRADPTRVRQILVNLVGNAVKFTARGGVAVDVTTEGTTLLRVRVRDSGLGLTPEQRERLFRPFGQADSSVARRFGGTGLGLALSRRLAEALGGELKLESSAPGLGSVFSFTLPLILSDLG